MLAAVPFPLTWKEPSFEWKEPSFDWIEPSVVVCRPLPPVDLDENNGCDEADVEDATAGTAVVITVVVVVVAGITSGGNKSIQRNPSAVAVAVAVAEEEVIVPVPGALRC